jgi:hypothetical protein
MMIEQILNMFAKQKPPPYRRGFFNVLIPLDGGG